VRINGEIRCEGRTFCALTVLFPLVSLELLKFTFKTINIDVMSR